MAEVRVNQEIVNGGMHLTLVTTRCSILVWKTIRGQFLSLNSVSPLKKPAENMLFSYVGLKVSVVLDAVIEKAGS